MPMNIGFKHTANTFKTSVVYSHIVEKEKRYLEKAVSHIYAYLELGYPYEYGQSEFEKAVNFLQVELEDIFPARKWQNKKIILNKGNVRNLLGRWNPSLHCMKISEVVADIMDKANRKICINMRYRFLQISFLPRFLIIHPKPGYTA